MAFIIHSLPSPRPTARRRKPPTCNASPEEPTWFILERRLAAMREREISRNRAVAHNWRNGKYNSSMVGVTPRAFVRGISFHDDFLACGTSSGAVVLTHMPSAMHCEGDKHIGQVTTLDYRDSTIATAGSSDCVVFVWDVTEAERALCKVDSLPEPVRLAGHTDVITAVRVDAENGHLYSASVDGSVRIWDRTTGNCVNIVRVGEPVLSMTLTGKGYLLVGCASGRVQAYSAEKGLYLLSFLCHKRHATAVAHWDEGDVLVTGDSGGSLNVWSMKDGSSLGTLPAHDAAVTSVQMDGAKIVSAARDGCVAVSAIDTMRRLYTIQGYTKYLTSAYFDDAKLIADGTNDVVVCHSFDPDAEEST